jgi:hypothetical protein
MGLGWIHFDKVNSSKRNREVWSANTERHLISLTQEDIRTRRRKSEVGAEKLGFEERRQN